MRETTCAEGVREKIRQNYSVISNDHLSHWRETGSNPWQDDEHVEAMNTNTIRLIEEHYKPGDKILDAGCGTGDFIRTLEKAIPGVDVRGCDFSPEYVEFAHELGTLSVVQADLEHLPYEDGTFDIVTNTDVLEHVIDPNIVVAEIMRVLKPGGICIVRTPDYEDLSGYLAPEYPYRYTHLRTFSAPALTLLFDRLFDCTVIGEPLEDRRTVTIVARKPE